MRINPNTGVIEGEATKVGGNVSEPPSRGWNAPSRETRRRGSPKPFVSWSPIEPLNMASLDVDFAEIDVLSQQWLGAKARAEEIDPQAYAQFNEELFRNWAIETGVIEGIYSLDSGAARTLVERGFFSECVERSATNKSPNDLIRILRDHRESIDFIHDWIADSRPLTVWFIRALHQAVAKSQPTYQAMDQFGRMFEAKLRRGEFKKLPNNPTRRDGAVHEYCPPEQVESELDNLITWHGEHATDCHPLAVGAWLHHRFAQIHPFADGNGRVVRALLAWHLINSGLLSVVVARESRNEYIDALERADAGDLSPFVRLLVKLERQTLLGALSVRREGDWRGRLQTAAPTTALGLNMLDIFDEARLEAAV